MAGPRLFAFGLSALLLVGASAFACTDCPPFASGQFMAPIYFVPSYAPRPCPCVSAPAVRYACPSPAPASPGPGVISTHEPPLATKQPNKGPTIYQNRTFSGVPQSNEPRTANCKVSFWNLTGLDVNILVGDKTHSIQKDRAIILDLNRSFTWRANALDNLKTEDVPDDVNHFEVMIR